ncbi:MAG: hypothetical protein HYU02_05830 [Thaumarchaeota archaeon]|nr:hypothetical protein [Nitrososphaerota archaeon]
MIRRSRLEVFLDIMKVAAGGKTRRTHIMYRANLAWTVLKEALQTLEERGILKSESKGREIYISLTVQGFEALGRFYEIERVFGAPLEAPTRETVVSSTIL